MSKPKHKDGDKEKRQVKEGMKIKVNQVLWDQGYGPLDDDVIENLGLEEYDLPSDAYGPLGVYRDSKGQLWELISCNDGYAEFYKKEVEK